MMMVVPVDAYIDKAQHVARENWNERSQRRKLGPVRWLQLQNHDGDDYREHAIAEGLESILVHPAMLSRALAHRNDPRSSGVGGGPDSGGYRHPVRLDQAAFNRAVGLG